MLMPQPLAPGSSPEHYKSMFTLRCTMDTEYADVSAKHPAVVPEHHGTKSMSTLAALHRVC
jgi:hypothetical protein